MNKGNDHNPKGYLAVNDAGSSGDRITGRNSQHWLARKGSFPTTQTNESYEAAGNFNNSTETNFNYENNSMSVDLEVNQSTTVNQQFVQNDPDAIARNVKEVYSEQNEKY